MSLLELNNIETYYGPIMAIRGISMQIEKNQITVVLGPNGAGKTTVLKTICGAIDPQKGKIQFDDKEIARQDPDHIARLGIGHVPEGREVFPFLTVAENLKMGAFSRNDNEVDQDLDTVFEYFPILKEKHHQQAGFLSGGQQQMLAIGRALMLRPRLMLLDEPSLGLSPRLVHEITGIIKRLNTEQQMTILLVEQNAKMALDIGDYGYVMELGRIVMEDTCKRLRTATDIQEFYLGMKDQGVRGRRRWKQRKTWR
ncbi:MAG: ABC transporter ATP-binding protein [Gammaproteobacteria bacterium]|jgi:branched-chain amino acid transport system ATP-binding protein|nr:ABC transporter ATP-binding protein [Gammaproteobacteria bacterium]